MRVPPPMPCAIKREPVDRARHVAVAQRRRDVRKPRVEHEGLGLAERIDDAVQEAHEERGVEAHRARGIEQHDEPQRLDLAAAPGEIDRRAAMRDVAMDGAAQVEAAPAPAHLLAPHQPRAHACGRAAPRARCVARDLVRIDDVAQVGGRDASRRARRLRGGRARRRVVAVVVAPLDVIRQAERCLRHAACADAARRRLCCRAGAPPASARCACRARASRPRRSRRTSPSPNGSRRTARAAPA